MRFAWLVAIDLVENRKQVALNVREQAQIRCAQVIGNEFLGEECAALFSKFLCLGSTTILEEEDGRWYKIPYNFARTVVGHCEYPIDCGWSMMVAVVANEATKAVKRVKESDDIKAEFIKEKWVQLCTEFYLRKWVMVTRYDA